MRRPRKAFLVLARKASYNNLSVPLLILLWLSLFFFAHAHHKDRSELLDDKLCWRDVGQGLIKGFFPAADCSSADQCCDFDDWKSDSIQAENCGSCNPTKSEGEYQNYGTMVKEQAQAGNLGLSKTSAENVPKTDRLLRDAPLGFDEFKNKAINPKAKNAMHQAGSIMHRLEPGGAEYNFASASKGAKLLASNKEAKGADNILGKDMDKYLRNPCSAEGKFVVIELSEETLIHTIGIANFEHHSSNLKGFEFLGSLVYPTESWLFLGNFTAKNIKQSQRFSLKEHKWVRYLKLNFLSHYGSEFYCTLSTLKVYGVDAVEHMLGDLISIPDNYLALEESTDEPKAMRPQLTHSQIDDLDENLAKEGDTSSAAGDSAVKLDASVNHGVDQVEDLRQHSTGRLPGDTVLKILMQKVRALDLNLSVLERYLDELNMRYRKIFTDFEKEIAAEDAIVRKMSTDLTNLGDKNDLIEKDVQDIMSWKSIVTLEMDILKRDNALLRLKVERILENQVHMENKEIMVLLISLVCSVLAFVNLFAEMASVCRRKQEFGRFWQAKNISWILFLLCSSSIGIILLS